MSTVDDLFDEDELSTSSTSDVEHAASRPPQGIIKSDSDYSDDSLLSADDYTESDDQYDDDEESEEEEAWNSTKKTKKRQQKSRKTVPPRHQTNVKRRKTKQEEYEGVTDSDSDSFSDYSDGEQVAKRRKPEEVVDIPFLSDNKGRIVDAIIEYNPEDDLYLIKWKHRSYREASWENEDLAEQGNAVVRKMQNAVERFTAISEDELEEERERRQQYCEPERVFNMVKRGTNTWYLVKWRGLPYKESTWEIDSVLFPEHHQLVDAYLTRTMVKRPVFKKPRQFMKITPDDHFCQSQQDDRLRDYQMDGVNWLTFSWFTGTNVILADEMGLGKTIQSVVFLNALRCKYNFHGPSMVVVPLSTIDAWQREFQRWAPAMNVVVYNGDADSRRLIRHYEFQDGSGECVFDALLTTYELVLKDKEELKAIRWRQLIVDEGHRLKNTESQLFEALNYLIPPQHRILITGTPLQNSLKELWSLLHFLDPITYTCYQDFHHRYAPPDGPETPAQAEARTASLHAILKPHLLRRMKKDVEQSLPAKREQILRVDLAAPQKDLYRLVLAKNYVELQKQSKKSNLINVLGELKKICNHPLCFTTHDLDLASDRVGIDDLLKASSKLALMDMLMTRLMSDGHRALIFSQSVKMLDVLELYLRLRRWSYQRIDGGVPSEQRRRAIDAFNAADSPDVAFLLSTRAGGLGINLETADTVIIYDSDWNPQNDLQAMARAHRIGQRRAVNIYRLVTSNTVEETILERAKQKMVLDHLVIQRMPVTADNLGNGNDELQAILKFGAQSLFTTTTTNNNNQIDLDAILERAQETTTASTDFLGQFQVADVGSLPAWEQIIPVPERQRAEAEAAEQALIAKEGALQEAILTTSRARRTRTTVSSTVADGGEKQMFLEATRTGLIPPAIESVIAGKQDDQVLHGIRVGLLKQRQSLRRQIDEHLSPLPDALAFRLHVKVKQPSQWTTKWGPRDDAMLLVGVHRHGFQWEKVREDRELALPYTLEKGSVPLATHLQRRVEYLVGLLRSAAGFGGSASISQGKTTASTGHDKDSKQRQKGARQETETNHKKEPMKETKHMKETKKESNNDDVKQVKQFLKPVKKHVEFINTMSADQVDSQLQPICEAVRSIGHHINSEQVPVGHREAAWRAVAAIWPTDMRSADLQALYAKLQ